MNFTNEQIELIKRIVKEDSGAELSANAIGQLQGITEVKEQKVSEEAVEQNVGIPARELISTVGLIYRISLNADSNEHVVRLSFYGEKEPEFWNVQVFRRWLPTKFIQTMLCVLANCDKSKSLIEQFDSMSIILYGKHHYKPLKYKRVPSVTELHEALNSFMNYSLKRENVCSVPQYWLRGVIFTTINVFLSATSEVVKSRYSQYSDEIYDLLYDSISFDTEAAFSQWLVLLEELLQYEPAIVMYCMQSIHTKIIFACNRLSCKFVKLSNKLDRIKHSKQLVSQGYTELELKEYGYLEADADLDSGEEYLKGLMNYVNDLILALDSLDKELRLCDDDLDDLCKKAESQRNAIKMQLF